MIPHIARRDRFSDLALKSLAGFGLSTLDVLRVHAERQRRAASCAAAALETLKPGTILFITGPSGSGKSTLLREFSARLGTQAIDASALLAEALRRPQTRVVDLLDPLRGSTGDPLHALRALAAVGLADAMVPCAPVAALSEGEQARLAMALALAKAGHMCDAGDPAPTILIDEFCSTLDHWTAQGVCRAMARAVRRAGLRLLVATCRAELAADLQPDSCIDPSDDHAILTEPAGARRSFASPTLDIRPALPEDFARLAALHYRSARPATIVHRLGAFTPDERRLGVLTISLPTLNGAWRRQAWGDRYCLPDKRAGTARLNREVRCISRVIVTPEARGQGVATALIRSYLSRPLTEHTEAVASMGHMSPLFERAGMTPWNLKRPQYDERVLAQLEAEGVQPWHLADPPRLVRACERDASLERALRIWAGAARATRQVQRASLPELLEVAARRLTHRPVAFTYSKLG